MTIRIKRHVFLINGDLFFSAIIMSVKAEDIIKAAIPENEKRKIAQQQLMKVCQNNPYLNY